MLRGAAVLFVILSVTVLVYFIFSLEVASQIYINYRANPPGIICSELFETYGEAKISYMAGLEYLYLSEADSGVKDMTEKIS